MQPTLAVGGGQYFGRHDERHLDQAPRTLTSHQFNQQSPQMANAATNTIESGTSTITTERHLHPAYLQHSQPLSAGGGQMSMDAPERFAPAHQSPQAPQLQPPQPQQQSKKRRGRPPANNTGSPTNVRKRVATASGQRSANNWLESDQRYQQQSMASQSVDVYEFSNNSDGFNYNNNCVNGRQVSFVLFCEMRELVLCVLNNLCNFWRFVVQQISGN